MHQTQPNMFVIVYKQRAAECFRLSYLPLPSLLLLRPFLSPLPFLSEGHPTVGEHVEGGRSFLVSISPLVFARTPFPFYSVSADDCCSHLAWRRRHSPLYLSEALPTYGESTRNQAFVPRAPDDGDGANCSALPREASNFFFVFITNFFLFPLFFRFRLIELLLIFHF